MTRVVKCRFGLWARLIDSSSSDEKLFNAVIYGNIDEVKRQLRKRNINVNCRNGNGETALFISLKAGNFAIFECLLNSGFDIHFRDAMGGTPLHVAATFSGSSFVHALIKRGADVNAKKEDGYTPLSDAAFRGNLDTICTLLYYDADVNTVEHYSNMNPFMLALESEHVEVASILFDFYDDFSRKNSQGRTALHLAAISRNPLCIELFKKSPYINECLELLLLYSLKYKNAELFKLIWHRHKEEICLEVDLMMLLKYLLNCGFSNSDFFDCLYLLFTSSAFENLLRFERGLTEELLIKAGFTKKGLTQESFLGNLIFSFYTRKIGLHHRMVLINLCLSVGRNVSAHDINMAYFLYGFNEEVETFIHTFNCQQPLIPKDFLPLPRFIFVLEDNYKIDTISAIFKFWEKTKIELRDIVLKQDLIVNSLGYTTLSTLQKQTIKDVCMHYLEDHQRIIEKLDAIPDMPSLVELSRNRIRQQYSGAKSYQLHTAINELNLPPYIKDVICFKAPIY